MLSELVSLNVDVIAERTREKVNRRDRPPQPLPDIDDGVPLFLTQLAETLKQGDQPSSSARIFQRTAAGRGAVLSAAGFTPAEIVHDYGAICQAVTEVAKEREWEITAGDFQILNGCLDDAIAEAVNEHARLAAQQRSDDELERLGLAAHELRDALTGAVLAFHALKRGAVGIDGSTGSVLGRSLADLQGIIDRTVSQVRLAAGGQHHVKLSVAQLCDQVSAVAALHSEHRGIYFRVDAIADGLFIEGDAQLLASAVMNLVHNAFKNTPRGGTVRLRTRVADGRLLISVEDECGGLPDARNDFFKPFGDRRGRDRSGLGLGLSIARRAVQSHRGEITITNVPGVGCIFTINVPLVEAE